MNKYIYKVYGAYSDTGYKMVLKDTNIQKVYPILQNKEYSKIMVVRYDVLQNMDETIMLVLNGTMVRKLKRDK